MNVGFIIFIVILFGFAGGLGIIYFNRYFENRRKLRLAKGWQIANNNKPFIKILENIARYLMMAWLGGWLVKNYHLNPNYLFYIGVIILILTPHQKWIRSNSSNAVNSKA